MRGGFWLNEDGRFFHSHGLTFDLNQRKAPNQSGRHAHVTVPDFCKPLID